MSGGDETTGEIPDDDEALEVVYVVLKGDDDGPPPMDEEPLWGLPLDDPDRFRIVSSPMHAVGVNYADIVRAEGDDDHRVLAEVVEPSGFSTVRIILSGDTPIGDVIDLAKKHGCHAQESAIPGFIGLDVPAEADLGPLEADLEAGFDREAWDFELATLTDDHRAQCAIAGES